MDTIQFKDKPFLIIGSSGQEKELTQEIINKYNSIAINRSNFDVDIIFRCDRPYGNLYLDKCKYFLANEEYKKQYDSDKVKFFKTEYKVISKELPILGIYYFTVTAVLNYITLIKPKTEVYLIGIDHSKGQYAKQGVREFIEQYKKYLTIYQTDFNSKGWNLEYKEIK